MIWIGGLWLGLVVVRVVCLLLVSLFVYLFIIYLLFAQLFGGFLLLLLALASGVCLLGWVFGCRSLFVLGLRFWLSGVGCVVVSPFALPLCFLTLTGLGLLGGCWLLVACYYVVILCL